MRSFQTTFPWESLGFNVTWYRIFFFWQEQNSQHHQVKCAKEQALGMGKVCHMSSNKAAALVLWVLVLWCVHTHTPPPSRKCSNMLLRCQPRIPECTCHISSFSSLPLTTQPCYVYFSKPLNDQLFLHRFCSHTYTSFLCGVNIT